MIILGMGNIFKEMALRELKESLEVTLMNVFSGDITLTVVKVQQPAKSWNIYSALALKKKKEKEVWDCLQQTVSFISLKMDIVLLS